MPHPTESKDRRDAHDRLRITCEEPNAQPALLLVAGLLSVGTASGRLISAVDRFRVAIGGAVSSELDGAK